MDQIILNVIFFFRTELVRYRGDAILMQMLVNYQTEHYLLRKHRNSVKKKK